MTFKTREEALAVAQAASVKGVCEYGWEHKIEAGDFEQRELMESVGCSVDCILDQALADRALACDERWADAMFFAACFVAGEIGIQRIEPKDRRDN